MADTVVGFLHDAYLLTQTDPAKTFEPYENFSEHNKAIDAKCSFSNVEIDEQGFLSGGVSVAEGQSTLPFNVSVSELLFGVDKSAYKEAWLASGGERLD